MAKIQFRIRDANDEPIAGASLVMRCTLDDGEEFRGEPQTADKAGVIWLEIEDRLAKKLDWSSLSVEVSKDGVELSHQLSKPQKIDRGALRVVVTTTAGPEAEGDGPPRPPSSREERLRSVSGSVTADDGSPRPGLVVRAVDRGVGEERRLGQATTDAKGRYRIDYGPRDLLRPDRDRAHLVVRVNPSAEAGYALAESPLRTDARRHERVDLRVPRERYRGESLFELVRRQVAELGAETKLEGLSLADAKLIALDAGLDTEVVVQFIQANQMAVGASALASAPVSAEPIFGAIRAGMPANPAAFASLRDTRLRGLVEEALAENWVDGIDPQGAVDALRPLRARLLRQTGEPWVAVLRGNGATDAQVETLTEAWLGSDTPLHLLPAELAASGELPAKTAAGMDEALALYRFAGASPDLLDGVLAEHEVRAPADLARLSSKDWTGLVGRHVQEMPEWVEGTTRQERVSSLAGTLQGTVERAFPTRFFSQRWKEDEELANAPVQTWLERNPQFDFTRTRLEKHWQDNPPPAPAGRAPLERTERLFQIAPDRDRFSTFKVLWQGGVDSARDVLNKGRGRFVADVQRQGLEETVANDVYQRAQRVSSQDLLSLDPAPVARPDDAADEPEQQLARVEPTLAALFGDKGGNGCDHCVSVTSPGAYLVDMLRFLERSNTDPAGTGKSGLELLFERRPDIANLRLDCRNSETPLPYIDLVNEVLEHVVATSSVAFRVPEDWMIEQSLDLQTGWTAEELAAHPEHLAAEAYTRLRNPLVAAPWNLPYDLWADEVRTYLPQIGVDRTDLMSVLRPGSDPFRNQEVAAERLALDASEVLVLSVPADNDAKRLLVWQTADPATHLKRIRDFLRRTGLSYEEAADILATRFVNPTGRAVLPGDLSDLEAAELDLRAEDNDGLLDWLHRFTRLWRKTGWSTVALDAVLESVLDAGLDAAGLADVGVVAELHDRYGTPIEELAAWFGPINTVGNPDEPALYQRSFLDGSVAGASQDGAVDLLDEVFRIVGMGGNRDLVITRGGSTHDRWLAEESTEVPGEWVLHPDYGPIVLAGCRVSAADVGTLIGARLLPQRQARVTLNLANLSKIYRQSSMARALGISVPELVDWQAVLGQSLGPERTENAGPAGTLRLILEIQGQLDAGIGSAELLYALEGQDVTGLAPIEETVGELLDGIRTDLEKTADNFRVDALVAADQLALWLSLTPAFVADADEEAIGEVLAVLDGTEPLTPALEPDVAFLRAGEPRTFAALFGPEPRTDSQERMSLAAAAIPVDTALVQRVDLLLLEEGSLDEAARREILATLCGLVAGSLADHRARFEELLPEIDHSYLRAGGAEARLREASRVYYDAWVRGPLVVSHLAAATELSDAQVGVLSGSVPAGKAHLVPLCMTPGFLAGEAAAVDAAEVGVRRLHRQAALVKALGLEARELEFAKAHAADTGLFDFSTVGRGELSRWQDTVVAHGLDQAVRGETDLYDFLTELVEGGFDEAGAQSRLGELFEVATTEILLLAGPEALAMAFPQEYATLPRLDRLHSAATYLRKIGADAGQLIKLAEPLLSSEHGGIAKAVVRSHYGDEDWREVSEKLREGLRERQRNALLGFVRTRGALDLGAEAAYAYYLIDVEMGGCYRTSRTKQAIASVQQFVQRILLGLEMDPATGMPLDFFKEDALEWQWRKNYRVWEANVKVFIYPENWLEPELRDDKTPFFETLEQELLQGELTNDAAEVAVTSYLESLHQVANLEIVNLYDDSTEEKLYAVGRTRNVPHRYYLRIWEKREIWTPWEPIETEISGEHVIPAMHNRRLHLFWPTFSEELNEEELEQHSINEDLEILDQEIQAVDDELSNLESARDEYEEHDEDPIVGAVFTQLLEQIEERIVAMERQRADLEIQQAEKSREYEHVKEQHTYVNIELNWVVRTTVGWSGKNVSRGLLRGPDGYAADRYRFSVSSGGGLTIYVHTGDLSGGSAILGPHLLRRDDRQRGAFRMVAATGEIVAYADEEDEADDWMVFQNSALINTQHSVHCGVNMVTNERLFARLVEGDTALLKNEEFESFVGSTSDRAASTHDSFFLADEKRTFFLHSESSAGLPALPTTSHQKLITEVQSVPRGEVQTAQSAVAANPLVTRRSNPSLRELAVTDTILLPQQAEGGETQRPIEVDSLIVDTTVVAGGGESYEVENHYHAYTDSFLRQIRRFGIPGLYTPDYGTQQTRDAADLDRQMTATQPAFDFDSLYPPNRDAVSGTPMEKIDFSHGSGYGQYNWEVFFHTPMLIAVRLMQDQKFEEAQRWFHYIFDPTERRGSGVERYWKIKPFYYAQAWGQASEDLDEQLERIDEDDAMSLDSLIDEWEANPFQPHAIARFRIVAYMRMTVMKYLDNLIAWGDSLFRRDTMEFIGEATQLYVLAATILGERPLVIDEHEEGGLGFTVQEFLDGAALGPLPAGAQPGSPPAGFPGGGAQGILGVLDQFCLPYNERLLQYWDTIADRLFKIRHCQNIDGVYRQLPLYQPPIDPALLVKAAAAGVDLSSVLSDLAAPRPSYRFSYMAARASELAGQAQTLAGQLLAALEKRDAEALGLLRADHELTLLDLVRETRQLAVDEAEENLEATRLGRDAVELRRQFYAGRERLSSHEASEDSLRDQGKVGRRDSAIAMAVAGPLGFVPDLTGGVAGIASPVTLTKLIGGTALAAGARLSGEIVAINAALREAEAGQAAATGGRSRRQEEWNHQAELAEAELAQFDKQIVATEVRLALAERELANQETQIEQAGEAEAFLKGKFTNEQLYSWLVGQLSTLYFQTYQLAYDLAKRAERCYRHELGVADTGFIQFGYWNSLKRGLLAGERLQLDLKRMEAAYVENDVRELELTKTVSLAAVNAEALLRLRETGECFVSLPEVIFDLDYPGHYFRRIKSVSLTLPAITGPYTSVSCTLTLLSDHYRKEPQGGDDETLFEWNVGAVQSIATSSGQADSGLFQLDFKDERYLPFERAGVASSWKMSLPDPDMAQFDYATISDVLIRLSYTARDGGQAYREEVAGGLVDALNSLLEEGAGLPQFLSVRTHFPDAWTAFRQGESGAEHDLELEIGLEHLPYFVRRRVGQILSTKLLVLQREDAPDVSGTTVQLNRGEEQQLAPDPTIELPAAVFDTPVAPGPITVSLGGPLAEERDTVSDLLLIFRVQITS